jgi:hypothetical protein
MHFHKITLYNAIAHGKRDDNLFYGGLLLWPLKHLLAKLPIFMRTSMTSVHSHD